MGKYLISGVAGTGKTAVVRELIRRGYAAYSTDEIPEVTQLENLKTGEFIKKTGDPIDFSKYGWNWQEAGLKKLLSRTDNIFVAASVSNQDKFNHLFDKIFALSVDEATLRQRLAAREKDDNYGKHPADLARILELHKRVERHLIDDFGALPIDATQPLEKVADDILANIHES